MTAWHRGILAAFDTESTGIDPTTALIVTATLVIIEPGAGFTEKHWLLDPGTEIPAAATAIHGVTTQHAAADGQQPAEALEQILRALTVVWQQEWPLIAYNAPYDLTLLDHELARHDLPTVAQHGGPGLVIDPLVCDRRLDTYRKGKRTLTAACEHYGVRLDGAHDATQDALAAARVAWRLAEVYPAVLQQRPLEQLQADQARWQNDWADHFETYQRRTKPNYQVDRGWPYRPARQGAAA